MSRRLPRSESPTSRAPVSTAAPTNTPISTALFPRQWKKRLRKTSRLRFIRTSPPRVKAHGPLSVGLCHVQLAIDHFHSLGKGTGQLLAVSHGDKNGVLL